jgi:hypothetical protein
MIITWFHSFYLLITGLWPVFDIVSFMAITGYKVDQWLVKMVGLLAASIGGGLLAAAVRKYFDLPLIIIMLASSVSFLSVDVYYSFTDRIADIYLLDAIRGHLSP